MIEMNRSFSSGIDRRSFIIGACGLTACATSSSLETKDEAVSAEEYAIYNAYFSQLSCEWIGEHYVIDRSLVLVKERSVEADTEEAKFALSFDWMDHNFSDGMIADIYQRNASSSHFEFTKTDWDCVDFVNNEEARSIRENLIGQHRKERDYREARVRALVEKREFSQEPVTLRSVHRLSRCGFDASRKNAIFVSSYYCGLLCAAIELHVANNVGNGWGIVDKKLILIS